MRWGGARRRSWRQPNAPPIDLLSSDSEGEDAPAETPDGPDEARADAAPPSSTRALEPSAAHAARVTAFLRGVDAETRAGLLEEIQRAAADLIRLRGELRRLEGAIREGRRRKSRAGGRAPEDIVRAINPRFRDVVPECESVLVNELCAHRVPAASTGSCWIYRRGQGP